MEMIDIICSGCGQAANVKQHNGQPTRKFCNKACARQYYRTTRKSRLEAGVEAGELYGKPAYEYYYNRYRISAENRGISFCLSLDEFRQFWQLPCYYCASPIQSVGIDRKDNEIGYEVSNCLPCCTTCNLMKRGMDDNQYITHCKVVAGYH